MPLQTHYNLNFKEKYSSLKSRYMLPPIQPKKQIEVTRKSQSETRD